MCADGIEEFVDAVLALPAGQRGLAGGTMQHRETGKWYAFAGNLKLKDVLVTPDYETESEASEASYTMLKDLQACMAERGAVGQPELVQ